MQTLWIRTHSRQGLFQRMSFRTASSRLMQRITAGPGFRLKIGTFGIALGAALLAGSSATHAQSPVCSQIRTELSQLGASGGGGGATRESMRMRTELSRVQIAIQQNDCNRSGFLGFNAPPPVCGPLKAQASQYTAQIRQIEGGSGTSGQRRAQLVAALERYGCLGSQQQAQPQQRGGVLYAAPNEPGLMERLFGQSVDGRGDQRLDEGLSSEIDTPPRERLGGRMAVCVRTCDGYYFPVNFEGIGARDEYASVCQSLCPAAETQVFFMPLGAEIDRAATRDGTPYMSLPAAKKYQQSRDPACFCKQPTQTWASAMKGIEDLVEARKGDIVVTQEQAQAMSRPKGPVTAVDRKGRKQEPAKVQPEPEPPVSLPDSALPTGGTASAGIGPRINRDRVIPSDGGTQQQVIGADGNKRQVRNVAPGLTVKEQPIDLRGAARP